MTAPQSPFIAALPEKPEMACVAFYGKNVLMRMTGWEQHSMEDARALALKWINANHGIEIFTIETTLTDRCAVVTVWYRSPFSTDGESVEKKESISW